MRLGVWGVERHRRLEAPNVQKGGLEEELIRDQACLESSARQWAWGSNPPSSARGFS
jgi:hypothetical protein